MAVPYSVQGKKIYIYARNQLQKYCTVPQFHSSYLNKQL